jgi:hypothetical protein
MEKTPYQELICLSGTKGFQKEERVWKMTKRPGHLVTRKTDENVEEVRTLVRTDHSLVSGEVEHGQTNGETNFNNKLKHEECVGQNVPKVHQFLAGKQISMLKHTPYSLRLFPELESSLNRTHFQSVKDIH